MTDKTLSTIADVLARGSNERVRLPTFARASLRIGMAHIGVGNFHRGHQVVYLDDLLEARPDQVGWGYLGISLLDSASSYDRARAMVAQDNHFTVTEYDPDGTSQSRILGSIIDYLHAPTDPAAVVHRLTDPAIRIVSLTVSEGGYDIDETTGEFRIDAPHIAADLQGEHPRTTWGTLVAALRARRSVGHEPFTILSCDNLRSNGDTARRSTVGFAEAVDLELAAWISGNVAFPNSKVDRIAPVIDDQLRVTVNELTGVNDAVPVVVESFKQWVVEDEFPTGRPAWEVVGVQLRPDVAAFESIKGRMLNASHVIMSYPSLICGFEFVNDAAHDDLIRRFILGFMDRDAIPLITPPSDVSLTDYRRSVLERFSNVALPDTLHRIATDGTSKIPIFHRATTEELIAKGADTRREALLIAAFRRYFDGVTDTGRRYEVIEVKMSDADKSLMRSGDPRDALRSTPFAGWGLLASESFVATYLAAAGTISQQGMRAAVEQSLV